VLFFYFVPDTTQDCPGHHTRLSRTPHETVPDTTRDHGNFNNLILILFQLFDLVRCQRPEIFKKLKLISGDILEEGLGISNDDRVELQKNCQILFHSAACVRYIIINTYCTSSSSSSSPYPTMFVCTKKGRGAILFFCPGYHTGHHMLTSYVESLALSREFT
jgi:hypothetical protein